MDYSNKNEKSSVLEFEEIKLDDIEVMEEAVQPGGLICGLGCVAGGAWCGSGCPH